MKRKTQITNNVTQLEYNILMAKPSKTVQEIAKAYNLTIEQVQEVFDKYDGFEIRGRVIF